ncbi:hypothetical protein [Rubellicoccus peritrichatus]|uniref:Outer membrane lipoprotein-sorting protein n=1 Tax=Rubellicoccus peritrichatus TaxID=3080537 RepID=A0AAQ3L7L6_9BACT|nr:hypothetical protein [Puniceicoccus sp. CR14]WOO39339.1 hypothetical protein RZN69_12005 [Puniceicoccus sp. CR14]
MLKKQSGSESDSRGVKGMLGFGVTLMVLPLIVYWYRHEEVVSDSSTDEVVEIAVDEELIPITDPVSELAVKHPENPNLDWIVAAHLRALGGKERLLEAKTMVIETEADVDGLPLRTVTMRKRPRFVFQKSRLGDAEKTIWSNGAEAWVETKHGGEVIEQHQLSAEEYLTRRGSFDYDNPIVCVVFSEHYPDDENEHVLEFEGRGEHAGEPGYWLVVDSADGWWQRVFLNQETMVIDYMKTVLGDSSKTYTLTDYREVDGLMIPFRYVIESSGKTMDVEVKQYRFNKFMYDALFRPQFANESAGDSSN